MIWLVILGGLVLGGCKEAWLRLWGGRGGVWVVRSGGGVGRIYPISGYANYSTYCGIYHRRTVGVIRSSLKRLRPRVSDSGYFNYRLYRVSYPIVGGRGLLCPGSYCTLTLLRRGSLVRDTSNKTTATLVESIISRNNVMCKYANRSIFRIRRVEISSLGSVRQLENSGCIRSRVNAACERMLGSLGSRGVMLFAKAPYRVTNLGSFLQGSCSGLTAVSLMYRNIPSRGVLARGINCCAKRGSNGGVGISFHGGMMTRRNGAGLGSTEVRCN